MKMKIDHLEIMMLIIALLMIQEELYQETKDFRKITKVANMKWNLKILNKLFEIKNIEFD